MKDLLKNMSELNIFLLVILISLIVFKENIDLFKLKILYYITFVIFVLNVILVKNNPGIIILYSCLFMLIWYDHNIKNNN